MVAQVWRVSEPERRLDLFVVQVCEGLSRSAAQRLIAEGRVRVNGALAEAGWRLRPGDEVTILLPPQEEGHPQAEAIPLSILYEDEHLLVVNKPAGMATHPGAGRSTGTLVNALLAHRPEIASVGEDPLRPGIVHRLDRETSGVLVVAATEAALKALQGQFRRGKVEKRYLALVYGHLSPAQAAIEAPIGRDPIHRQRMAVLPEGRRARTEYRLLRTLEGCSLLVVHLLTGRTHQVRVHLASIGHPVVGDRVYGPRRQAIAAPRQFLHAWWLAFDHPVTGARMAFEAPLPADLRRVLEALGLAEKEIEALRPETMGGV